MNRLVSVVICFLSFSFVIAQSEPWIAQQTAAYPAIFPDPNDILCNNNYWQDLQKESTQEEKNEALLEVISSTYEWSIKRYHIIGALTAGADVNTPIPAYVGRTKQETTISLLNESIGENDCDFFEFLLKKETISLERVSGGKSPFLQALLLSDEQENKPYFLRRLLEKGVNPNEEVSVGIEDVSLTRATPLFLVKTRELAELLRMYGVNPSINAYTANNQLWSLPHWIAKNEDVDEDLLLWCAEQRLSLTSLNGEGKTPADILKSQLRNPEQVAIGFGYSGYCYPKSVKVAKKLEVLSKQGCLESAFIERLREWEEEHSRYFLDPKDCCGCADVNNCAGTVCSACCGCSSLAAIAILFSYSPRNALGQMDANCCLQAATYCAGAGGVSLVALGAILAASTHHEYNPRLHSIVKTTVPASQAMQYIVVREQEPSLLEQRNRPLPSAPPMSNCGSAEVYLPRATILGQSFENASGGSPTAEPSRDALPAYAPPSYSTFVSLSNKK